jgi:hypothetical protein
MMEKFGESRRAFAHLSLMLSPENVTTSTRCNSPTTSTQGGTVERVADPTHLGAYNSVSGASTPTAFAASLSTMSDAELEKALRS